MRRNDRFRFFPGKRMFDHNLWRSGEVRRNRVFPWGDIDRASDGVVVIEPFIRGAPFQAPILFSDLGALCLIALLRRGDTKEQCSLGREVA